jgi:hypothetical protein
MALYAAYASNMDPRQMVIRAPHSPQRGIGWLVGWRLTFGGEDKGWEGPLATVVEDDPTSQVFVALYEVTDADALSMDRWEHPDLAAFRKIRVRVATLDGEALAWLYVLDAYEGGLLAEAAEAAGAPDDYVHDLRTRPCRSVEP